MRGQGKRLPPPPASRLIRPYLHAREQVNRFECFNFPNDLSSRRNGTHRAVEHQIKLKSNFARERACVALTGDVSRAAVILIGADVSQHPAPARPGRRSLGGPQSRGDLNNGPDDNSNVYEFANVVTRARRRRAGVVCVQSASSQ
ncbi:hypothetical protein EVAR_86430_1 [Eumeta japonica]|uniref:Uncharacterized protein n=1 Tax=Eumeta variegata TaxID=151549 RepID=A0A4C1ZBD1_EUMVA|nr:hypothetical protein EVAR_86430_1 [Eumeta japonica]